MSETLRSRFQRFERELKAIEKELAFNNSNLKSKPLFNGNLLRQELSVLIDTLKSRPKSGMEFNQILKNIFPERLKVQAIEYRDEVLFAIQGKAMPFRAFGRTAFPSMLSSPTGNRTPV